MAKVRAVLKLEREFEAKDLEQAEYLADYFIQMVKSVLPEEGVETHIYIEED